MTRLNLCKNLRRLFLLTCISGLLLACEESIDTSNRYTFTEETVLSYLEKHSDYSEYVNLIHQVPVSKQSKSSIAQLLSARGHFTVFAPNNTAIQFYLDSLQRKGIISAANWDSFPDEKTLDSIQQTIVYNSIIDGGNQITFETGNFPTTDNDEFGISNLNDRKLSVTRSKINPDSIFINGEIPISLKNRDIVAINGCIHEVEQVIAPSNDRMTDIFMRWAEDGNSGYSVMSRLILACDLSDTLRAYRDETWEELYTTGQVKDLPEHTSFHQIGSLPAHRKYGFTIFAETDAVWEELLGKDAMDITVADVKEYLLATGAFTDEGTTTDDNFGDVNNILNQFVTYHVLPMRIPRDKLVVHYNEKGYNFASSKSYTIAISDFYTTMGKPRLIKLYESLESNGIYINRFPVLRNGRGEYAPENKNINDYHESGSFKPILGKALTVDENVGIEVLNPSNENVSTETGLNGLIYPINKLLVCTENVRTQMMNQRIRIDVATMFPEMLSNDLHGIKQYYTEGATNCRGIPTNYHYLADVDIKEGTMFYYLPGLNRGWCNMEGDEFNVIGRYEFTMKLPPVPKAGHYELRFGVATGSSVRSMAQVYWGPDKDYMPAYGIPMDLRQSGLYRHLPSGNQESSIGWESDTNDEEYNDEVTKKMRNNGFMKGPESWCARLGTNETVRSYEYITRRIMISEDMEPNKNYYIRFKSVLDSENKEFFMDYIEYVAKEVYDNPIESEDIW
ncbi:MAG: fasciclin domain-containing protein [Bacteroidaceae bacterium]|nr:fasciclin domain-containing protein [Bacteroidaceae bacterium]